MTSITRSGRVLKHEGTSSTKSGNAAPTVTQKDSPHKSPNTTGTKNRINNNTAKDAKSSTPSGSAVTDSFGLRKSSRETPTKKTQMGSSSSKKPEVENPEKKRQHSPLRRSERIEKNGVSRFPGWTKRNKCSSPPLKKKKLDEVNGRIAVTNKENESKDKKLEIKATVASMENKSKDNKLGTNSSGRSKKKTSMTARRYRALLLLQAMQDESSDDYDVRLKDDSAAKENSSNSASSSSKKEYKGLDESGGRKDDMPHGKCSVENSNEAANGSCPGSKELAELNMDSAIRRKSDRLSGKEKYENKSLVSKCTDSSSHLQSSIIGFTTKNNSDGVSSGEFCGVDDTCYTQRSGKQELEPSRSVVTILEGQSLTVDKSMECWFNFEDSKNTKTAVDLDSNVSISAGNKNICNPEVSKADVTWSMPCGTTSQDVKRCNECNKLERIHNVSEAHELCSCNAQGEHDLVTSKDRRTYQLSNGVSTADEHLKVAHLKEPSVAVDSDSVPNVCIVCKHPGQLLCCYGKGCKQRYHPSCLSPPLLYGPLGVWLCHSCVKKKVVSGVYSVSEGIESVWDVKEGSEKENHYLVKYKGLAHVHNRWVPESQIILEAPILATKFDKRHRREKWEQEWTEPHRILLKRQLMPKDLADELFLAHGEKISYCYHEWLVKWKGLDYEHATWELENSPFLCSSEAKVLISDFESRHEEAKRSSDSARADKALPVKKGSFHKLKRLPYDCPAGLDNHLNFVNRLRECWHKSQNAVFIGDQERIVKSILFMLSLKSHTCRPFLVISTIHSLSLWETEFVRLARSINVVVYTGTKDVRKLIRTLEFYGESGCVLFQVILSHPDAIVEDFDALECIGWEALIIDECQNPGVSKQLEHFKTLSTEFRLLLLSGQLKDNVADYVNLLSLLESGGKENGFTGLKSDGNDTAGSLCLLKEKLTPYLVYDRKSGSSKFLEFWVPVQFSNVQVEQYCSILVSNSITLHSCSRVDHVGALRDILISTRKCCDHPYLVDGSLQSSLAKDLPYDKILDIGVKASGKLHLLDKFLHEINKQGLRVLILFQSIGGAGRDSIGDILDDFLRQRFGPDSFERIDSGLIMSKKIAALTKFNDMVNGRFFFLLENRACLPSIKLSSVDAVVIFNSDWNPLNDLRALQKIHIESQFDCVKVFRLYSSCTVEEKVLIFAKQDIILDNNIQHISPSNSHLLLSWGAFYLFNELDEFHQNVKGCNDNEISIDEHLLNDSMLKFLNDVIEELVKELPGIAENNTCQGLLLVKAQQNGSSYAKNIRLVGEKDGITSLDRDPPSFWSKLLEKRYPLWRFISEPSPRIRRKVPLFETSVKLPEVENDEARKKRRKLSSNTVDPISLQTRLEDKMKGMSKDADISQHSLSQPETKLPAFPSNNLREPESYGTQAGAVSKCMPSSVGIMNHETCNLQTSSTSDDAAELHGSPMVESEGRRYAQRTLHLCLKPELSELCDTLKLPDDVKHLAHKLLEYIMNNHHVNRDPETILQAFKLSLCWRAASFLKHKVDHKECLALAKKYLNYKCNDEQADSVYSKLRMLKKIFSHKVLSAHDDEPNSLENQPSTSRQANVTQPSHGGDSKSASSHVQDSGQVKAVSDDHGTIVRPVLEQEQALVRQPPSEVAQLLHGGTSASASSHVEDLVQIKAISDDHGTSVRPVLEQEQAPVRQPLSKVALLLHGGRSELTSSHIQDSGQIKVVSDDRVSDDHETSVQPVLEQEQAPVCQPPSEVAQPLQWGGSESASSLVHDSGQIKAGSDDHGTSVQPVLEQKQAPVCQPLSEVAQPLHGGSSESASSHVQDSGQIKAGSDDHGTSMQPVLEQELAPVRPPPFEVQENHGSLKDVLLEKRVDLINIISSNRNAEVQENLGSLKDVLLKKRVDLINIISSNRNSTTLQKHKKELSDFNVQSEKEKARLQSAHDAQLELIHSIHTDYRIRNDKIKLLNKDFSKKMSEFDQHIRHQRKKLAIMQEDAKNKEQNIRDCWLEEAKAGTLADSFDTLPLTETGFRLQEFKELSEKVESCQGSKQSVSDLVGGDLIATGPRVSTATNENHSEIRSIASNSSDIAEVQPLQPNGSSSEVLKTNSVEVEPNVHNGTLAEIILDSVLRCTDVIDTVPRTSTGTTKNHLEKASTSPPGVVEDAQCLTSHSNTVVEAEHIQQNGTSAELPETVPTSMVEMESIEPSETHKEITETVLPAADGCLLKNGGPEFSGSEVPPGVVEDVQCLTSHSNTVFEAEHIQQNGTSAELPETVPTSMVEVESIEPSETHKEITETILPAADGCLLKNGGPEFSGSEVPPGVAEDAQCLTSHSNTVVEAEHIQQNGTSAELPETVPTSMVEMESIKPSETHKEITETVLPAADGCLLKNGGPEFSGSEVMSVLGNDPHCTHMGPPQSNFTTAEILETVSPNVVEVESIEHQESYTEIPTEVLRSEGGNINEGRETPFSESDVMNIADNQPDTMYMAPSMVTSLPEETETRALQSNNMVQVETVDSSRTSLLPEECHVSMECERPSSQMNAQDNGSDIIVIDSTVETTAATINRDLRGGEDNSDGTQLGSSPLQNPADLPLMPHVSANSCCEKSLSNLDQVLQVNEHERPAVSVETQHGERFDSSHTTTPVSVNFVKPTAHHTDTSNPSQLQVLPVDNSPADNDRSSTSQPIRNEGELHTVGTHSSPSVALSMHPAELQAEESNQLAAQCVLDPSPPSGVLGIDGAVQPHGIYGTNSQNEVPAQQLVVPAAVPVDQSSELSHPVVHSSVVSANLLPDRTRSDGIESGGVLQEPGTRLLQILPMAVCVHPQALHPDPLQNELTRIRKQVELRTKMHEEKKLLRKLECEAELDKVRKKYEALLQDDEAGFHQDKKILDTIYDKVLVNQIFAAEFRSKFIDGKGGTSSATQGRASGSTPQFSQTPHATPRPLSTSFIPNLTNRPPIASPQAQAQVPISSSAPPGLVVRSTPSVVPPSTHVRSQFSPRPNMQGANDTRTPSPRAPAPHLHRFRPHTSSMTTPVILPPRPTQASAPQLPLSNLGALTSRAPVSTSLPSSRDLVVANVAPDMPNLPQMDVGHSLHGLMSHNLPVNISEKATTTNKDNVVCLSDDE